MREANMRKGKYAVVISEDAMVYEDLAVLSGLPAFGSVMQEAAVIRHNRSIYPTITYPCHVTMSTGCYPDRHGVINNEQTILTEVSSRWEHFHSAVKVPDIFDRAKENGLTTAAVFWPVTGCHPNIDWLIDEYWPQTPEEDTAECFRDAGTDERTMEIVRRNIYLLQGHVRRHPWADQFVFACACDIIRAYRPNLLMVHPANIDSYRHETGVFSPKVTHGLHECDLWLSDILQALDVAGIRAQTNVFVVSDHGQIDVRGSVQPNVLLRRAGLIDVGPDGQIADWRAVCKSTGASCQVWLRDPGDRSVWQRVRDVLEAARAEGAYGIGRVYTREETERLEHLSGGFSFVLETDGTYSFGNRWDGPVIRPVDVSDHKLAHGTHGHHPDKGPQPALIAFGSDIRPGAIVEQARIADIAPTVAAALGFDMPDTDGKPVREILL